MEQYRLERVVDSDDRKRRRRAEMAGGQRPRSAVTPQPSNRDHHSRFEKKLTAWNCVEVVVRSKQSEIFLVKLAATGCNILNSICFRSFLPSFGLVLSLPVSHSLRLS